MLDAYELILTTSLNFLFEYDSRYYHVCGDIVLPSKKARKYKRNLREIVVQREVVKLCKMFQLKVKEMSLVT